MATQDLTLLYGSLVVGRISKAFCSDATWYGLHRPLIEIKDGVLAHRLLDYINFSQDWNERLRKGLAADPAEFEHYADVIKSGLWSTDTTDGHRSSIIDAPVFFAGDEISWRI